MKYLIVGLGNIGSEYENTRHNIGFTILDAFARASNISFSDHRYGFKAELKHASRTLILLKPNTFMNLSGRSVHHWMQKEKIPLENVLVLVDDLALPLGKIRLRSKGGDAGHNGLKSIQEILCTTEYSRLRFGIGDDFPRGRQIDFVLGKWSLQEEEVVNTKLEKCFDILKSFATIGIELTMTKFNKGD